MAGKRPINSIPLGAPLSAPVPSWHIDTQPSLAREMVREVTAAGGVKYTPLVDLETETEIEMEPEIEAGLAASEGRGAQAEAGCSSDARPPPKRLRTAEAVKVEAGAEAAAPMTAEAAAPMTAAAAAAMAYKTWNAMTAAAAKTTAAKAYLHGPSCPRESKESPAAAAAAGQAAATPRVKTEQPQLPDASSGLAAPSLWWRKGRGRELGSGARSKVLPLGAARAWLLRLLGVRLTRRL